MKMNKKYIYPLIAVAIAGGIFLLVTKKKPKSGGNGSTPLEPPQDPNEISAEQKKIDAPLNTILANKNANVLIKNKKIFSKIPNAKGRYSPYVNDGFVDNIYASVANANTLIGTAVGAVNDKGSTINPSTNRPFVWVQVKLSKAVFDAFQEQRSFYERADETAYFREDVIKL